MESSKKIVLEAWREFAGHDRDRGDTVVVEKRMRATPPVGRPYDVRYCFLFELRDGLIHRAREYLDTRRGLEMFGMEPAST